MNELEIERLILTTTQPLAKRIVARYILQPQDVEDIVATVNLCVIRKLRAEAPIGRLDEYVAALTYNAVHDHLRRRYPERTRLKNHLRYVLTHDARLALWTAGGDPVAGLAAWAGSAPSAAALPQRQGANRTMLDRNRPADALAEILRAAGGPLRLETLLELAAGLWNVADAPHAVVDVQQPGEDALGRLEQRDFLRALWREISLLPPGQRKALLLNLREPGVANPIALLALTGTATLDDIARVLEMTAAELAALWNELPLDDLRIAAMLGQSRQQVINLRKSARQRLARRIFRGGRRS